jgi:hypothetical protein
LYFSFISSICAFKHNHLVEPGVEGWKVTSQFAIDTRTPEGLPSLTAILGQTLQARLTAGEAQRKEEARKAAEAKAAEKKRKRDERAITRAL